MDPCPHCKSTRTIQYLTFKHCLTCKKTFDHTEETKWGETINE